ncbi:alpha/beta hydrolase [Microbacterium sp. NPDC077184]|uniref:alpha/beta fold hydrolase n=1 Tax=Microbacterium sp. NPDC077184 TaxID=3154764 RepID=UPI00344885C9
MAAEHRAITAFDGATISYTVFPGVGPMVVVLHGLAGSGREFVPTAEALSPRPVILVDQRGHGASTRTPADVSRLAFVDDVVRVIEAEGHEPVDLVGQSMGAHTAMLVAAHRPDLVRRLVMLEGGAGGGSADDHAAIGSFFRSWPVPFADRAEAREFLGDGALARTWIADLEQRSDGLHPRFDSDVMVRVLDGMSEPNRSEWESVSVPTLVVYADGGMFTEEQKADFVARGRRAARVDLVGASHDAHLDAFDEWVAVLGPFLAAE